MTTPMDIPCRDIQCPKCGNRPYLLIERWRGHTIEFDYNTGTRSKDGLLKDGEPYKVEARCDCGNWWTLRGVSQITNLDIQDS